MFQTKAYFSCVYKSRLIRTLLAVSLGIFSERYFMVPHDGGFLRIKKALVWGALCSLISQQNAQEVEIHMETPLLNKDIFETLH